MDGISSTFLGLALPLIGVDGGVLQAAGFARSLQTCGTIADSEKEPVLYGFGFSHQVYGEMLVMASTEFDSLVAILIMSGVRPFDGDPLQEEADQCSLPMQTSDTRENELGILVTTEYCPDGSAILLRESSASNLEACGYFRAESPSDLMIQMVFPRKRT